MPTTSRSRRSVLAAGLAVPLLATCQLSARAGRTPPCTISGQAPFDMPALATPDVDACRPISRIHVQDVAVQDAQFVCRIKGQAELPVRDVRLRDLRVARVCATPVATEHVVGFDYDGQQRSGA